MHQPGGMQRQLLLVAVCTLFGGCTSVVHTRTISTGTLRDAARVLETERTASVVDSRGETFSLSRDDRLMLDDELLRLLPPESLAPHSTDGRRAGSSSVRHFLDVCGSDLRPPCAGAARTTFVIETTTERRVPPETWGYIAMFAFAAVEGAGVVCVMGEMGCSELSREFRLGAGAVLAALPLALIILALSHGSGRWGVFN